MKSSDIRLTISDLLSSLETFLPNSKNESRVLILVSLFSISAYNKLSIFLSLSLLPSILVVLYKKICYPNFYIYTYHLFLRQKIDILRIFVP